MIDLPLIRCVAATGKPTVISTGMATLDEITETVETFHAAGGRDLVLLHCVSGYPTPVEQSNLRRIPKLAEQFGCAVGLSDHTLGIEVAIASVALGACLIEKHFTLRRADGGPDFGVLARAGGTSGAGTRRARGICGVGNRNGAARRGRRGQQNVSTLALRR